MLSRFRQVLSRFRRVRPEQPVRRVLVRPEPRVPEQRAPERPVPVRPLVEPLRIRRQPVVALLRNR
ncbi:hypothetical protein [Nocardia sp. NPDC049149]|uniref:hypothetical protein n=1 Tax=Nocardia sp. NPDC049149 TaxID=3364315 RepID=UPI00371AD8F5